MGNEQKKRRRERAAAAQFANLTEEQRRQKLFEIKTDREKTVYVFGPQCGKTSLIRSFTNEGVHQLDS